LSSIFCCSTHVATLLGVRACLRCGSGSCQDFYAPEGPKARWQPGQSPGGPDGPSLSSGRRDPAADHLAIKTNSAAAHRPNKVQNATVPVASIDCRTFGFGAPSELQYTVASAAPTPCLRICGPQKNIRHSLRGATGIPAPHQEAGAPSPQSPGDISQSATVKQGRFRRQCFHRHPQPLLRPRLSGPAFGPREGRRR